MSNKREPSFDDYVRDLSSDDLETRLDAIEALADSGDPRALDVLLGLIREPADEEDEELLDLLYDVLYDFGEDAAPAVQQMFEQGSLEQKNFASELLGEWEWEPAAPAALDLYKQPDYMSKAIAAPLLGSLLVEEAVQPMTDFIQSQAEFIRRQSQREVIAKMQAGTIEDVDENNPLIAVMPTLQALADIDSARAFPVLQTIFTGNDGLLDPFVMELVSQMEAVDVTPWLLDRLHDPRPEIAHNAVVQLKELGDERVIEPFIRLLEHPAAMLRHEAIDGLGIIGDARALQALREMKPSEDTGLLDSPEVSPTQQLNATFFKGLADEFGIENVQDAMMEEMSDLLSNPSVLMRESVANIFQSMGLQLPPGMGAASEAELIAQAIEDIEDRLGGE